MRARLLLLVSTLAHASGGTVAGTLTVKKDGKPGFVKNALVYIGGDYPATPPGGPVVMSQSGRAFDKVVLPVVHKGKVQFSNDEPDESIYHHVFSPMKKVNLESPKYKPRQKPYLSPELTTDGPIDVFCDIHKEMIATLYVVPNDRFTLLSTAEGSRAQFKIEGIRPGRWKVVAWHRSAKVPVELPVEIKEGQTTQVDLVIDGENGVEKLLGEHLRLGKKEYDPKKPDGGAVGEAVGLEDKWK